MSVAPRGWRERERDRSPDNENYQMVCGHYQQVGVYRCPDCNLAPLSELRALQAHVRSLEARLARQIVSPWFDTAWQERPHTERNA